MTSEQKSWASIAKKNTPVTVQPTKYVSYTYRRTDRLTKDSFFDITEEPTVYDELTNVCQDYLNEFSSVRVSDIHRLFQRNIVVYHLVNDRDVEGYGHE